MKLYTPFSLAVGSLLLENAMSYGSIPRLHSQTLRKADVNTQRNTGPLAAGSSNGLGDFFAKSAKTAVSVAFMASLCIGVACPSPAFADGSGGASIGSNAKITTGGASTLQSGRTIAITRGVNLDRSDFSNQNLKGVAFQQSIVRDASFKGSNLYGSSFFDATLDGSDFENADMTLSNVEMAQFNRASLKNTVLRELYVSGSTLFTGLKDIEGSDWTDTYLRKDQQMYLCAHPTAKGTNSQTGVDTRESLMCVD
mmetsp:Transcript_27951/g.50890  ORF Transcript_27951/g.50890 Transcript_27951/m.50890 type:complete len:254 (-) Transcript_27951:197-958(-)